VATLSAGLSGARERQSGLAEEARLLVQLARAHLAQGDGDAARPR